MKAFRGQPGILTSKGPGDRRAELEVNALTLRFGGITAINGLDLTLRSGELIAVIGPNGAGKTSLLNCITGYYRPQEGRVVFNGSDITQLPTHRLIKFGIGRTYQNIELFPGLDVLANMLLARHSHCHYGIFQGAFFTGAARREEVRHRRILEELIDFLEMHSIRNEPVGGLPYGMRKRVELGRALALEPKLLLLDEPFAGMTVEEKEDMVRFLRELHEGWGQTMILVEHDMSIVMSISQRIVVLDFGEKIAEGPADLIQNHPQVIKAYLGDQAAI
jgi:branched-chain amino acid transport system ATP-binding protein